MAEVGDTDLVRRTSADWPIAEFTVAELFVDTGSVTADDTVAVFCSEAALNPDPTLSTTVAPMVCVGANDAMVHRTLPPSGAHDANGVPVGVTLMNVVPTGIGSVRRTFVAVLGPLLVAEIV